MSIFNTKTVKLFLSGISPLMVGGSSHASERVIYYLRLSGNNILT